MKLACSQLMNKLLSELFFCGCNEFFPQIKCSQICKAKSLQLELWPHQTGQMTFNPCSAQQLQGLKADLLRPVFSECISVGGRPGARLCMCRQQTVVFAMALLFKPR
jgi:hypothetical protein